jgi:CubicO group peptidase (beta-lactamase class C family)
MRAICRFIKASANVFQYGHAIAGSLCAACLFLLLCSVTAAQTPAPISGQPVASLSQLDTIMQTYMTQYNSPGASLAVTVDGRLVFARGYGYAKVDTGEFVQPDSLYRIASNSKPITAAGIYKLIEQGKLSLTTQPFATILNNLTPPPGTTIDPRYSTITIQQLLQHTAGFDDTIAPDPAQSDAVIAATTFGASAPATPQLLIKYILGQPLQHNPGTTYAYSNFGYITLGYIIEQVSGVPYATYIQDNVFTPAGIVRTQPGATFLSGRLPSEVSYYDYPGAPLVSSVEPPVGSQVPYPYGGYSCTLQLANGCWVSSTMDLLRFTDNINGQLGTSMFSTYPSSNPFQSPQFYFAIPPNGSGWTYTFYGSLPGTNSLVHLITDTTTTGKITYSAIFNTRNGTNIEEPESDADNAILAYVKTVKSWPTGDLFPSYSGTASSCSFTLASSSQSVTPNGNTFTVGVTDANYCAWSSVSNVSWIHITAGALNSDSGATGYTVDANTGGPRTGTITIAGQTFTVTQGGVTTPTTLVVAANQTAITAGQPVTLTATLSPFNAGNTSTNGETITFSNGGASLGTATLTSGVATLTTTSLPGGTDSVTASYPGDSTFGAANAASVQVVVTKVAATVTLGGLTATYNGSPHSATATTTPAGLNVVFTYAGSATPPTAAGSYPVVATISDPSYTGTASGALVIAKASATVTLGSLSATADGTAHAATATTVPAGLSVTFTYNGSATAPSTAGSYAVVGTINDPNYTGTATGTLVIAVPLVASSTALTSSAASVPVGTNVIFTATVTGSGGTPTGTVTFLNGTASLGTGTLNATGLATLTTSFSTAGTNSITAQYSGDAIFKGSTSTPLSETIVPVGVSATVSPNPLTIKSGSSGTLTITLTPTGGYTGTVSFSCGTLPTHASCTFAPTSVAITASTTTATDTLTVNTTTAPVTAMLSAPHPSGRGSGVFSAVALGLPGSLIALFGLKRRKQYPALRRLLMVTLLCLTTLWVGALSGCGGSSTNTTPGSYTVPMTLSLSGGASQTVNATVIVQ